MGACVELAPAFAYVGELGWKGNNLGKVDAGAVELFVPSEGDVEGFPRDHAAEVGVVGSGWFNPLAGRTEERRKSPRLAGDVGGERMEYFLSSDTGKYAGCGQVSSPIHEPNRDE